MHPNVYFRLTIISSRNELIVGVAVRHPVENSSERFHDEVGTGLDHSRSLSCLSDSYPMNRFLGPFY